MGSEQLCRGTLADGPERDLVNIRPPDWTPLKGCIISQSALIVRKYKPRPQTSRLLGEISTTSDVQMTPPLWQKVKEN